MNGKEALKKLDTFFQMGRLDDAQAFLEKACREAAEEGDSSALLMLLNEQIGLFRVTTNYEKANKTAEQILALLQNAGLTETEAAGTSYLNIATAYRAMGKLAQAEAFYRKAEDVYQKTLGPDDYRMAGLYNNRSLFYQERGDYKEAVSCLQKALAIVSQKPDLAVQTAVTHTNLGQAYCRMEDWEAAKKELQKAEEIFRRTDEKDEHFGGCLQALGYLYLQKQEPECAIGYYEEALYRVYSAYGRTKDFDKIKEDLTLAYRAAGAPLYSSMLEVCRAYYEAYGRPMIQKYFAAYENRIAVGLCGEGSECFGMEDAISLDHDCGPGFAMWLEDDTYEAIGESLQAAYEKLPKVFAGYIRTETAMGAGRTGVCRLRDFYQRVLGCRHVPQTTEEWREINEAALAAAVNGEVFADPSGAFTAERNRLLSYYPREVWLERLAKSLIYTAQTGQYNYGRSMARGDYVTAAIALSEYMQSAMQVVYLLNRVYAPYYKWKRPLMNRLAVLPEVGDLLEALCDMPSQREAWKDYAYDGNPNPADMIAQTIEIIAKLIVNTLQEMGLSERDDPYLEVQGQEVMKKMQNTETVMEDIIRLEWQEFDKARNEGGRASCQNDWNTFYIMRKSQYLTWNREMLEEYFRHLTETWQSGRNLIAEKYGRMMESTAPEAYEKIKDCFPPLSEERQQIAEAVIGIQVGWMEDFAAHYPRMAGNARRIHTSEDTSEETSYETYLRGELGTYSDELMALYGHFIVGLAGENKNLAYMTMENTARLYGYQSLEDAEKKQ